MIKNLKVVELEINSYCNRACPWCPNKCFDRSESIPMDFDVYTKILMELKAGGFTGVISYSRNNEPFADIDLLKKYTSKAKEILPGILLVSNTNGDFLSKEIIETSGIDELSIMDYDAVGLSSGLINLMNLGIEVEYTDGVIYGNLDDIKIAYCPDWKYNAFLEDRGGFFKQDVLGMDFRNHRQLRDCSCNDPGRLLAIDFNANAMPCCNMRSDNPDHEAYIMGNLKQETIEEIFLKQNNSDLINQINSLQGLDLPIPCQYCQKGEGRYMRENPSIYYSEEYINGEA